jgi:hypothetical protein
MRPLQPPIRLVVLACAVGTLTACGDTPVEGPGEPSGDTIPPAVVDLQPAPLASDVPVEVTVLVRFSEEINPATVGPASFLVRMGFDTVPGVYTFGDSAVGFDPDGNLQPASSYSVTLRRGIRDPAGNQLVRDTAWAFQTISQGTPTPPPQASRGIR